MEKITMYRAEDGTLFEKESECCSYEQQRVLNDALSAIVNFCSERICDENCPFYDPQYSLFTNDGLICCKLRQKVPSTWLMDEEQI